MSFSCHFPGPQSQQRTPTPLEDPTSRDRPRYHAALRRRRILHLQLPPVGRQQHRDLQLNQLIHHRPNHQHQQPPGYHQFQRQLHYLRHIWREVQTALFDFVL